MHSSGGEALTVRTCSLLHGWFLQGSFGFSGKWRRGAWRRSARSRRCASQSALVLNLRGSARASVLRTSENERKESSALLRALQSFSAAPLDARGRGLRSRKVEGVCQRHLAGALGCRRASLWLFAA